MKKIFSSFIVILCLTNFVFGQYNLSQVKQFYAPKFAAFNLTADDLNTIEITDQYTDAHNGVTHIYLRQSVNGIEITEAISNLHIDKNGRVIAINNSLVSQAKTKAASPNPQIGTQAALSNAAANVQMNVSTIFSKTNTPLVNNILKISDERVSAEPIKIILHYYTSGNELKLGYLVQLYNNQTSDWWNVRVDASTGEIIWKENWTSNCSFNRGAYSRPFSFANLASPRTDEITKFMKTGTGTYNVVPMPAESPNHAPRQLINSPATANASPFGWHDTNGVAGPEYTITRGNNVFAYDDRANKNNPGFSPDGGSSLTFDFPFNGDSTTKYDLSAAVTNLFYMNNLVHDVYYNYGFTEAAGNYQANNYGKGGVSGDPVKAEAQDGGGMNNANFSFAPTDGTSGRMQMYLWTTSSASFTVNSPNSIQGIYNCVPAGFGPGKNPAITQNVVLMQDAGVSPPTYNGCGSLVNPTSLNGKIALVDRSNSGCSYTQKVLNAQNNGAVAVIVGLNISGSPYQMSGFSSSITIPSFMISQSDATKLKGRIADTTVNVTIAANKGDSLDGDLDNGVITHESGHGVSIRLTGGPSKTSNCLSNAEQAGEGWSDFFALAFTARSGDKASDARGIATFVVGQPTSGIGIRTYPYSRDMTINPMTYSYIQTNPEVHYIGSFWATVLWDLYWNLVDKYGWSADLYNGTAGNNRAIQLVMDGLKLQVCSPGFIDSRNAIMLADKMDYGNADSVIIWQTFARRGMGYSASQGSSTSALDQIQKFDLPPGIPAGTNEITLGDAINVFPNPTSGDLTILLPSNISKSEISVSDITGKIVIHGIYLPDATNQVHLNLGELNNGIYFINATSDSNLFRSKIILTK
ncbi:MAG: T9SS-dependent M36 family metallopeptidase [Bacteroidia bacterium]